MIEQNMTNLQAVFRNVFDDDSITLFDEMTAADIDDWDSFNHIQLVVAIEKRFNISLNTAEIADLKNVGQMLDLLKTKLTA